MSGDSSLGIGIGLALKSYGRAFRGLLNQYPGAAAAYSLRKLSGSTSNVVRVRRSSDDSEQDFTAAQVDNGTLVNFANNGTSSLYGERMYFDNVNDKVVLGSAITLSGDFEISCKFFYDGDLSSSACILGNSAAPENRLRISAFTGALSIDRLSVVYSFPSLIVPAGDRTERTLTLSRSGSNFTAAISGVGTETISGTADDIDFTNIGARGTSFYWSGLIYDINLNNQASYQGYGNTNADWEDQIGSNDGTVNGSPALYSGQGFDGFVTKWYDQSGNGNDAVQPTTTAQPKIVDGGSLVAGGIDFDGVDDYFVSSHILSSDDVLSLYAVGAFDDLTQRGRMVGDFFYVNISDNGGFVLETLAFTQPNRIGGYGDDVLFPQTALSFVTEGSESLFEFQLASGSSSFYVNGSNVNTISATMNAEDGGSVLSIGAGTTGTTALIGQIKEIIIYNADKTSDMANIRGNINAHYNIYP